MERVTSLKLLVEKGFQLLITVCCFLALTLTWQGSLLAASSVTDVYPYRSENSQITTRNNASNAGENLKQDARSAVDRVGGSGTSNRIEGKAKQLFGNAQRGVDDANQQAERAAKRFEYNAEKDAGRTGRAIDQANDRAKDSAENAVDAVKGFFNR